jgi:hypothetical protein
VQAVRAPTTATTPEEQHADEQEANAQPLEWA